MSYGRPTRQAVHNRDVLAKVPAPACPSIAVKPIAHQPLSLEVGTDEVAMCAMPQAVSAVLSTS